MAGEVDGAVVGQFEHDPGELPPYIDAIDAGAVTVASSAGIAFLLRCIQAAAATGAPAVVVRSSRSLDCLLRVAGLEDVILRPGGR